MVGLMSIYFVTGVSGELGSRLLGQLAPDATTKRIIGIDRKPLRTSSAKLEYVQRDAEIDGISDLVANADTLIHLAPIHPHALPALLQSAVTSQLKAIVALSTASVYGAWPTNAVPLTEDSAVRPNPGFSYAVEAAETERLLLDWKRANPDVSVAVLRMAMTLGGGYEKSLISPLGVYAHRHQESSRPVQYLHIDDAVSALALAARKRLDGTFNVSPDGFISEEKARAVAGAPPRPGLPRRVAYMANDLVWRSRRGDDFAAVSPYLEYPWVTSNDRLRAAGWRPSYSTEEALVAEARPTWWARMGPGQRRAVVKGAIAAGSSAATLGLAASAEFFRRKRRS